MIVTEIITINGNNFKHTYSNTGYFIQKEGTEEIYEEAIDVIDSNYTYTETDELIPVDEKDELKLTRGDVFRGILQAKGITKAQLRAKIELMPETTQEEVLAKQLALIDFDDALYFYRRNPLIDQVGSQLGITAYQMTQFFETNDWHYLMPSVNE